MITSLRDHFASQALSGVMGNSLTEPTKQQHFDNIAEDCYRVADAMLKRRKMSK